VNDSIADSLRKVRETAQLTIDSLHEIATNTAVMLDEKQLQSLNIASSILMRVQKVADDGPVDPAKLTDAELAAKLAGK
jgi:hypothetical protein